MQNVFTDKPRLCQRADLRDGNRLDSASGKKSKQEEIDEYKKESWTVEYPDGHKEKYDFRHLEEKYNELKDERTKLSAEFGEVLKPVTEASTKADEYISDHMVDLTPAQIDGSRRRQRTGTRRFCRLTSPTPTSSTAANPATWAFASR